jgi:hypothetical protein
MADSAAVAASQAQQPSVKQMVELQYLMQVLKQPVTRKFFLFVCACRHARVGRARAT